VEKCPPLLANHEPGENESDIVSLLRNSAHASPMFPVGNFLMTQNGGNTGGLITG
jgi:hypothetical protein